MSHFVSKDNIPNWGQKFNWLDEQLKDEEAFSLIHGSILNRSELKCKIARQKPRRKWFIAG